MRHAKPTVPKEPHPFDLGIIYVNKQVLILTAFVSSLQVRTLNLLNLNMLRLDSCADGR